jgi:hypothetical protein
LVGGRETNPQRGKRNMVSECIPIKIELSQINQRNV